MIVIYYLFVLSFVILLVFYIISFYQLAFYKPADNRMQANFPPVSVIICAKNEADNIKRNLPSILCQNYPEFEVIVVDDNSTDETLLVLKEYEDPRLRIIENRRERRYKGKRNALLEAMQAAKYDHLLLTDADCIPVSKEWIYKMVQPFNDKIEIVLGYAPFNKMKGLFNQFVRFENVNTAIQYLTFALVGFPYMGVGRNIAYRKSVLSNSRSFEMHKNLLSGDDDLLINEMATSQNTAIVIDSQAHVYSEPKLAFKDWLHQKRRHASAGFYYKPVHKLVLGVLTSAQVIFWSTPVGLLLAGIQPQIILTLFLIKTCVQVLIFHRIVQKLEQKSMWIMTPFYDFMLSLFFVTLGGSSIIKVKTWK